MTSDKQNVAKPFTPSLSAAFHRSSSKTPLTPKLASPSPAGYRTPRRLAQSEHPLSSTTTPSKDDYQTPSFLSANVTPRSNSRTTRRESAVSSPNSTPSATPSAPSTPYSPGGPQNGPYRSDRSPVRGGKLEPPRASRARTLTAESQPPRTLSSDASSPMFFHASDARSTNNNNTTPDLDPKLKLPGKQSSPATFFYANGEEEKKSEEANPPVPQIKRRSTGLSRSVVSKPSTPAASPRVRSSRPSDSGPRVPDSASPTPQNDSTESPQRQSMPVPDRQPAVKRHIKSSSLGSASNSPREGLKPSPVIGSSSDPPVDAAPVAESLPGLRPRISSHDSSGSGETASPGKSDATAAQPNDPAASARIERKIMDLEISNSSLLAINRTLEREMRKQNAELRRFRRLSRAGRLSVEPTRSVSGPALSTTAEEGEGPNEAAAVPLPAESSASSEAEDEDEDSADEGVMSPGSLAENDEKHCARDEKRVFIDLAKHQELLVDSQKMNQSLRRCLGWTEELIKEGQRALDYNVHVNDVELGGRVLAPEELRDIGESARGLMVSNRDSNKDDPDLSLSETDPDPGSTAGTETETETETDAEA